jgi:hypothetical protein
VTINNIPRDDDGKVVLPLELGPLTLVSLGKIEYDNPSFHCARHIYPVGYTVERTYMSMVNEHEQAIYTCKVTEGNDGEPVVSTVHLKKRRKTRGGTNCGFNGS